MSRRSINNNNLKKKDNNLFEKKTNGEEISINNKNERQQVKNIEMLVEYYKEGKTQNGFELFISFAYFENINKINIDDIQKALIELKEKDKYKSLLEDYDYNMNGQSIDLIVEIYLLINDKKLENSSDNRHLFEINITHKECMKNIKSIDLEKQKLMFDLVNDFELLASKYKEKTYSKAI